ncbi:MAG: hypothetical protein MK108_11260 [Mariniblastus sp.]|nr:hypothetical protein [Mariniblastus sp.]
MKRSNRDDLNYEKFEDRLCLTVAVAVHHGSMVVHGDADGAVEVVGVGERTFTVSDNGVEIGTYENVHNCLRVEHDRNAAEDANDDSLSIELRDQHIHNIMVKLGHGDNDFDISGDHVIDRVMFRTASGNDTMSVNVNTRFMADANMGGGDNSMDVNAFANRVRYRGGHGADSMNLNEGAKARVLTSVMGHGANDLAVNANVHDHLYFRGGADADAVSVAEGVHTHGNASFMMGHGDNTVDFAGWVGGHFRVRGGEGADTVNLATSSFTGHHAGIILGAGDNTFNLDGGGVGFYLRGEGGNDDVNLGETVDARRTVVAVLGDGDNTFNHDGYIKRDLFVVSKNADDLFSSDGTVDGRTWLKPGGQKGG